MRKPAFTETTQIGVVVHDVDAAVKHWEEDFGIGPWQIWEMNPSVPEHYSEYGEEMRPTSRNATCQIGSVWWEIVQPMTDVGLAAKWLAERGEGVYRIAVRAADYEGLISAEKSHGRELAMNCRAMGVDVSYLDTEKELGVLIEVFSQIPGE